ncbi:MAG TPA: tyrosine-type recombinase/integrase [Sphaerochaeta sp.]|mgnify:FL=1|nr:tyrosine-type recombinase/integrase [Sphaerochaeta sp.]
MATPAPFTLCRIRQNERVYFYALFRDPESGKRTNKKSVERLRTRLGIFSDKPISRRDEAIRICQQALEAGLIFSRDEKILMREYLVQFYSWEESEYIKRRNLLSVGSIGKDYVHTRQNLIKNHLLKHIKPNLLLSAVTLGMVEDWQFSLVESGEISHSTINVIMTAVIAALREAQRRGKLSPSVVLELKHLDVMHKGRGILTEEETARFLQYAKEKSEKRIYLACLLSLVTGMRSGELRALRVDALCGDMIVVDQAYADQAGLKAPKGKITRHVPCPLWLISALETLAAENPYESEHHLVFWSKRGGGFVSSHYFSSRFKEELVRSGVLDERAIEERNISFHSLRHMANTLLRGSIDEHLLRLTIGHSSVRLSDLYTHLSERGLQSVALAQERTILTLLGPSEEAVEGDEEEEEKDVEEGEQQQVAQRLSLSVRAEEAEGDD